MTREQAALLLAVKMRAASTPTPQEVAAGEEALRSEVLAPFLSALRALNLDADSVRLENKVAQGASGEVWAGRCGGVRVAVKRLLRSRTLSPHAITWFFCEAVALTALAHPNIVALVGVQLQPPYLSIVLQLAERGSLLDALRAPGMMRTATWAGSDTLLRIALQTSQALGFVHAQGWVHHDNKAANVMLSSTFGARLGDFGSAILSKQRVIRETQGLASVVRRSDVATAGGTTAYWSAPEILRGERFGSACDVWSFGVLLVEMHERRSPYHGLEEAPAIVLMKVGSGALKPSLSPDGIPDEEFVELAESCFASDPRERPDAPALVSALRLRVSRAVLASGSDPLVRLVAQRPEQLNSRKEPGLLQTFQQVGEAYCHYEKLNDRQHWVTLQFQSAAIETAYLHGNAGPRFQRWFSLCFFGALLVFATSLIDQHSAQKLELYRDLKVSRIGAYVGFGAELIACRFPAFKLLGKEAQTANAILVYSLLLPVIFTCVIQTVNAGDNLNFAKVIVGSRKSFFLVRFCFFMRLAS
jgi:serine/threonine protein kinase